MFPVTDAGTLAPSVRYVVSCVGLRVAQKVVHVVPVTGGEDHSSVSREHELEAPQICSEEGAVLS